jgi:hypothetical protein
MRHKRFINGRDVAVGPPGAVRTQVEMMGNTEGSGRKHEPYDNVSSIF